ncbi:MAG: flavin reductase family protein [bacterium]
MKKIDPVEGLRLINSGPVIIVTSGPVEEANPVTLAWNMVVSKKPPLAAFALVPTRHSHKLIMENSEFVINIPGSDLLKAVMVCGTRSGRDGDKFGPAGLTAVPAETVNTAYITECPARLECALYKQFTTGDHSIIVGGVLAAFADEEAFDGNWKLNSPRSRTLHHLGGEKFGILNEWVKA